MTTRTATIDAVGQANNAILATWAGLVKGDDGSIVEWVDFCDRCIQVTGIFGGAKLVIEGSNDGCNAKVLKDLRGDLLAFTGSGLEQALELPRYMRPVVKGGNRTTNLTVTLCARRAVRA